MQHWLTRRERCIPAPSRRQRPHLFPADRRWNVNKPSLKLFNAAGCHENFESQRWAALTSINSFAFSHLKSAMTSINWCSRKPIRPTDTPMRPIMTHRSQSNLKKISRESDSWTPWYSGEFLSENLTWLWISNSGNSSPEDDETVNDMQIWQENCACEKYSCNSVVMRCLVCLLFLTSVCILREWVFGTQ